MNTTGWRWSRRKRFSFSVFWRLEVTGGGNEREGTAVMMQSWDNVLLLLVVVTQFDQMGDNKD